MWQKLAAVVGGWDFCWFRYSAFGRTGLKLGALEYFSPPPPSTPVL